MSAKGRVMAVLIIFGVGAVAIPCALTFLLWRVMGAEGKAVGVLVFAVLVAWVLGCLFTGLAMNESR